MPPPFVRFKVPPPQYTVSPAFEKVTYPIRAATPSMSPSLFSTYMTRRRWFAFIVGITVSVSAA